MEEIWKDIEGYEGRYQVSNKGRVKSLFKTAQSIFNGVVCTREYPEPMRWTPQIGETIFWVNANLTVSQDRFNDYGTQRKRRAAGNEFKTAKEAEQFAEAVRKCFEQIQKDNQ